MSRHKKDILAAAGAVDVETVEPATNSTSEAPAAAAAAAAKQKRDNLFSEPIPREVIDEALHTLHFSSIKDSRVFTLKDLKPDNFDPALLLIAPYYIPCKAKKYLYGDMTNYRVLTVLRQLLRSQGYGFFSQERTVRGKKELHYQIRPFVFNDNDTEEAIIVRFD